MGDADQEKSQSRPEDGAPHADQHELRQRVCIHTICRHEQGGKDNHHANKDGNGFSEGSTGWCIHFNLLNLMGFDAYRIAVNQEPCQLTKDVLWVYFWKSPELPERKIVTTSPIPWRGQRTRCGSGRPICRRFWSNAS